MNRFASFFVAIATIAMLAFGVANAAEEELVSIKANKGLYAGYTAVGKAPSGRKFRVYFGADGTVKYADSKGQSQTGVWLLTDDGMMCYDWKKWRDRCYTHRKEGKFYQSYREGKTKGSKFTLVKGDIKPAAPRTLQGEPGKMRGLLMPMMNPARGRQLFASKGCVACHSVNGIGGEGGPPIDANEMAPFMNPFEFAAKMWRGAPTMALLQEEVLGEQIEFTGDELADIIAFAHSVEEQRKFTKADIPARILELMNHAHQHEKEAQKGVP